MEEATFKGSHEEKGDRPLFLREEGQSLKKGDRPLFLSFSFFFF